MSTKLSEWIDERDENKSGCDVESCNLSLRIGKFLTTSNKIKIFFSFTDETDTSTEITYDIDQILNIIKILADYIEYKITIK